MCRCNPRGGPSNFIVEHNQLEIGFQLMSLGEVQNQEEEVLASIGMPQKRTIIDHWCN